MDLRLYKIDDTTRYSLEGDAMEVSSSQNDMAEGLEVLANKVVKFLLTIQGSDAVDPDYGCTLSGYTLISTRDLPVVQLQLVEDLERCAGYIKAAEYSGLDNDTRLSAIELVKLVYDKNSARDVLHVYIRIKTKSSKEAVLQIPVTAGAN